MASVSSKTNQIADEKLEEKKEVDDINKLEGEENTVTYSAIVSEEKPESPQDVSIVEETDKSGTINESETLEKIDVDRSSSPTRIVEVNVKDLEEETDIPEEQKKESSDDAVPDATDNDDLDAPTSTEISVNDLEVQSAFPEEQKQEEKTTETQDPSSNGARIDCGGEIVQSSSQQENGSGDAEAVQKKERNLEEVTENPVETLEAKTEVAQNSTDLSTIVSEETPESPQESETLEKIDADWSSSLTRIVEVNVKDLEEETGIPEEQKKESSDDAVPDAFEATDNDDLNAPTSTEISVNDLEVQSAFPEEQKQEEKTTETQDPSSNGATIDCGGEVVQSSSQQENGSGEAEAVQKKERNLEEVTENPVETLEAKTEAAQNSTDLSAIRAPESAEIVNEEKEISEKRGTEATVKDLNIVPEASEHLNKDKKVSINEERMSENLKDVDATSEKVPKDFTTVEESPQQVIEKNKNKSFNDFETPEFIPEVVKDNGSSEMVEEKKSDSEDHSLVEKNVQIPDDKKVETQLEEPIQIATEKSENELGTEREESQKSKDVDPAVSSDTANTNLIKESTKRKSNNFFSMAKRSIVKAKKAILGKSPGPKTVLSEIKDNNS